MMSSSPRQPSELLFRAIECIIQSRVSLKQEQMKRFEDFMINMRKHGPSFFKDSLDTLYEQLLPHRLVEVRNKLGRDSKDFYTNTANIEFSLVERDEAGGSGYESRHSSQRGKRAEVWQITVNSDLNQSTQVTAISETFKELIHLLNTFPLFSVYHKSDSFRKKYQIKHAVNIGEISSKISLLTLPIVYLREHQPLSFKCYYDPNLAKLFENKLPTPMMSVVRESSVNASNFKLHSYYDETENFLFISSDNEAIETAKNGRDSEKTQEHISSEEESDNSNAKSEGSNDSEGCQLISMDEDETFLKDNKSLFLELSKLEAAQYN